MGGVFNALFTGTMKIQEGKRRERKRSGVCMHMIYISELYRLLLIWSLDSWVFTNVSISIE